MKVKSLYYTCLGAIFLAGCAQEGGVKDQDIALMARLQCETRHLKEERFGVVDRLRLRDDSLMKNGGMLTDAEIAQDDSLKTALTLRTSIMATRFTAALDSVFKANYPTQKARQAFDEALANKADEICP